jgi:nucleotide-binding universal stress UspA family protein
MFESVVVGATSSEAGERAFTRALGLTRAAGGTLHVVCALAKHQSEEPPVVPEEFRYTEVGAGQTEWLMGQLKKRGSDAGVRVATHAVWAKPADAISHIAAEEHADLVVIGSSSAHGTRRLSSVPKAVLDSAPCAVLVV